MSIQTPWKSWRPNRPCFELIFSTASCTTGQNPGASCLMLCWEPFKETTLEQTPGAGTRGASCLHYFLQPASLGLSLATDRNPSCSCLSTSAGAFTIRYSTKEGSLFASGMGLFNCAASCPDYHEQSWLPMGLFWPFTTMQDMLGCC